MMILVIIYRNIGDTELTQFNSYYDQLIKIHSEVSIIHIYIYIYIYICPSANVVFHQWTIRVNWIRFHHEQ
jgi:hypothetical protein